MDTLFRYGGDEFVLLLPDIEQADALRLAVRLTDEVRARNFPGKPPLAVSVSLGVATYPDDADTADELIGRADRRNYLAKRRGRGGAVADDTDTSTEQATGRLWERDTALTVAHEFFGHGVGQSKAKEAGVLDTYRYSFALEEFYAEYSGLWRHALEVRYRYRGKLKTYVQLGAALATRKVTLGAVRKGMNIAKVFSKPETFLRAHQ